MSEWSFWQRQLAGENPPSLVRGVPEWGFFLLREWASKGAQEGVESFRRKREVAFRPVAIWQDDAGWHCVITRPGRTSHLTDPAEIDETVFASCCRAAIPHDEYLTKVKELENDRERGMESAIDGTGLRSLEPRSRETMTRPSTE